MTPEQTALFLGPFGLTLFLMYVVKRLWDDHDEADKDAIAQRNEAIAGWRLATDAVNDSTAAVRDATVALKELAVELRQRK